MRPKIDRETPRLDHHLQLETPGAGQALPAAGPGDRRFSPGQLFQPLKPAIASVLRRRRHGAIQVVIRFHNGYGAIISEHRLLEGTYEVVPLRFEGEGPEDYQFHFRSHVPDLTWCSGSDEIVSVCAQIARLLPHPMI
jgi:hypothetical protein